MHENSAEATGTTGVEENRNHIEVGIPESSEICDKLSSSDDNEREDEIAKTLTEVEHMLRLEGIETLATDLLDSDSEDENIDMTDKQVEEYFNAPTFASEPPTKKRKLPGYRKI